MTRHGITSRTPVQHAPIAGALREIPGLELAVGTYPSRYSAMRIARSIERAERMAAYAPAGSFEARCEDRDDGTTAIYARYIGEAS